MKRLITQWSAVLLAFGLTQSGHANLVQNGDFEAVTSLGTDHTFQSGELGYNVALPNWTSASASYNFVFAAGVADTSGADGFYNNVTLWGPANGAANGLTPSSPAGGNYVAGFGDFTPGPLSQTINGLVPGSSYVLSFYMAGAQQFGYTGAAGNGWTASLGAETQSTHALSTPSEGFTGWQLQSLDFTATTASETLSFTPFAIPTTDFEMTSLLDGVYLELAPPTPPNPPNPPDAPDAASTALLLCFSTVVLLFAPRKLRRQH